MIGTIIKLNDKFYSVVVASWQEKDLFLVVTAGKSIAENSLRDALVNFSNSGVSTARCTRVCWSTRTYVKSGTANTRDRVATANKRIATAGRTYYYRSCFRARSILACTCRCKSLL